MIAWITKRNPLRRTPLDIVILVYVAIIFVKTVFSIDPAYSLHEFRSELLRQICVYYMVSASLNTPKYINRLLIALMISLFIVSAVGIIGYYHHALVKFGRATSYFGSFGRAAFYSAMIFPLVFGKLLFSRKWLNILVLSSLLVTAGYFMIITLSRGAWISTFLTLVILTAFKNRRMLIVVLIVILLIPWFLPSNVIDRAATIFQFDRLKDAKVFGDRWWMWKSALEMIRDRPLLGAGYGNRIYFRLYPEYIDAYSTGLVYYNAHNLYLQIAVETGLIGLLSFLALLFMTFRILIQKFQEHPGQFIEGQLTGIAGSLSVFVLFSITTFRYEDAIGLLFWFLLAAVAGLAARDRHPRAGTQEKGLSL